MQIEINTLGQLVIQANNQSDEIELDIWALANNTENIIIMNCNGSEK